MEIRGHLPSYDLLIFTQRSWHYLVLPCFWEKHMKKFLTKIKNRLSSPMEITKEEIFRVGHATFPSEKEAQDYIDSRDKNTSALAANIAALASSELTTVPVLIDGELDFFGNRADYETLSVRGQKLGFISEPFKVLTPAEAIRALEFEDSGLRAEVFEQFIECLVFCNDVAGEEKINWRSLLLMVGQIQISPELLYDD